MAKADPEGISWRIATRKEDFTKGELEQRASDFFTQMAEAQAKA